MSKQLQSAPSSAFDPEKLVRMVILDEQARQAHAWPDSQSLKSGAGERIQNSIVKYAERGEAIALGDKNRIDKKLRMENKKNQPIELAQKRLQVRQSQAWIRGTIFSSVRQDASVLTDAFCHVMEARDWNYGGRHDVDNIVSDIKKKTGRFF